LRAIQPGIIINNRSRLAEDFGTPEEHVTADNDRDWEACMTLNNHSFGYLDAPQVGLHTYNAQRVLKMLSTCAHGAGNLLLNIGPAADGSVPPEAVEPLSTVGKWLAANGECAYGKVDRFKEVWGYGTQLCTVSGKRNTVYLWNWFWPKDGELIVGGFTTALKSAKILASGESIAFSQEKYRIILKGMPKETPDKIAGVAVIALEFSSVPEIVPYATTPHMIQGVTH
ncbi:MAG: alpha-L-fucosidase, partial [Treponema sp.]|nr:alpha-L-fucosidase [Treponema sp.]